VKAPILSVSIRDMASLGVLIQVKISSKIEVVFWSQNREYGQNREVFEFEIENAAFRIRM